MYIGEIAAILAATCWTVNSIISEKKGKHHTALAINYGRQLVAFLILGLYVLIFRFNDLSRGLDSRSIIFLCLSGLVGFTIGDSFLFLSYKKIGSQLTLVIFSISPVISSVLSYFIFHEVLSVKNIIGILIIIIGIIIVIFSSSKNEVKIDKIGILFAVLASFGQAFGIILSKLGLTQMNAFTATEFRLLGGLIGISIIALISKDRKTIIKIFKSGDGRFTVLFSAIMGTCIGVGLSMIAVKMTKVGIASTLMSTSPILIIPILIFVFKQKLNTLEIVGSILSVVGIALLF